MNKNDIVQYSNGDISIKKVLNGWMLIEGNNFSYEDNNEEYNISVYESSFNTNNINDTDSDLGEAEALSRLLFDAFEEYIRSKKYGGITVTFHKDGYENLSED